MANKKVLITGITGFAGSYLAEYLLSLGEYEVAGTHVSDRNIKNLATIRNLVSLYKVNLLDKEQTRRVIAKVRPQIVFHLAASTNVADSFIKPAEVITNNVTSQVNLCESIIAENIALEKLLIVSSSHIYGLIKPLDLPLTEETPFMPDNPYSVSKIAQDYLGLSYYFSHKLPVIRVRPSNHIGPRLSSELSVSRFAKLISEIESGRRKPVMHVGNITCKRDFTDVRDMVQAYELAVRHCTISEAYNIGSGRAVRIESILKIMIAMAKVKIDVKTDPALFRPSDVPEIRVNSDKFYKATGWKPTIPLEQTLEDTLNYWREQGF